MTVDELIDQLQKLKDDGKGSMQVGFINFEGDDYMVEELEEVKSGELVSNGDNHIGKYIRIQ